jgi:16S rRNA (adenine1518-N6/adenine1519-N6)-dimethyltransferase
MARHIPRKRFGQNFLKDNFIINQILSTVSPHPHIVEIGPGLGALTAGLIKLSTHFSAIEIDRDLAQKFRLQFNSEINPEINAEKSSRIQLYEADALKFDFKTLSPKPFKLVGNLPYNISTPLLFHLFESIDDIESLNIMLQKEVVDRLAATPDSKDYGRLSVMAQYFCEITPLLDIPPESFYPAPQVDSGFVRLTPRANRQPVPFKLFEEVVREAFHCRRKTLANNLKKFATKETLTSWGINPSLRAEVLGVPDFIKLTLEISANTNCHQ